MKTAYTFDKLSKAGQNKAIRTSIKEFNDTNSGDEMNGGYVDENTRDKRIIEAMRKDMSDGTDLSDGIRLYSSDGVPIYSSDAEYNEIERPTKGFKFPNLSYKDSKSDKQYQVKIDSDGNAVIKFGKTGSALREMKKSFANEDEAIEYAYSKYQEKIKGGYTAGSKFDSKRRASKRNRGENKSAFRIMKAKRLNNKVAERFRPQMDKKTKQIKEPKDNVDGYWISEKVDGFRAIWTGKEFRSKQGNVFNAPDSWISRMPKDIQLDGELWLGRGNFQEGSSIVRKKNWDSIDEQEREWDRLTYVIFDSPSINKNDVGFTNTVEALNDILRGIDVGKTSEPKEIMGYETIDNSYGSVEQFNYRPYLVQVGKEFATREQAQAYIENDDAYSDFEYPGDVGKKTMIEPDVIIVNANTEFGLNDPNPYRVYAEVSVEPDKPMLKRKINTNIMVAPQIELENIDEVNELLDLVVKQNGEGLMMRKKNSPFEPTNEAGTKRSSSIFKVKPRFTEEGLVVGYEEGLGSRSGAVGSLIVKSTIKDGSKATWKLGSGLKQTDIANPPKKNTVIEYSFDGKTNKGIPRHGVFVRRRPDLDPRAYARRQSGTRQFNGKAYSLFQRTGKANKLSKNNAQTVAKKIRSLGLNARVVPFQKNKRPVYSVYVGMLPNKRWNR
jgi:ATP-dependent DNA ligase